MSKFDEAIDKYRTDLENINITVDEALLRAVTKGLGPSIYNRDSQSVAFTDPSEVNRVRANFLIKKLGMADNDSLDALLDQVKTQYSKNPRYRAVVYYLLTLATNKQAIYL